jgi:acyl-CoA synthetase (AMP-forming)/AMP-acid ligase II
MRTFGELDQRTDALAAHLQERVAPGSRVGIHMKNRIEWAEGLVAAHKAGVPAVPITHRYKHRELSHIVADAGVALLLADEPATADGLGPDGGGLPVLCPGAEYEAIVSARAGRVTRRETGEDVVMYTSGSTAMPKGVRFTGENLMAGGHMLNLVLGGIQADDRYIVFTPLGHRLGQARVLYGLLSGATGWLMEKYSPVALAEQIAAHDITVVAAVPTAVRDLHNSYRAGEIAPMKSVRLVHLTGEALPLPLRNSVRELLPDARISSFYAATECSLVTHLEHEEHFTHPNSCGRAVPGVEIRIVDDAGSDCPVGAPGEIVVRSGAPGTYLLSAGYLSQPDGEPMIDAEGWYATGDIGMLDAQGYLTIVDRKKDVIVSGGLNISARDVEEMIATCPGVREVAVTGQPDEHFQERVVAWVVREDASTVTAEDIVRWVSERAASYKKPKEVRFLSALPRTASGKVAKRELQTAE